MPRTFKLDLNCVSKVALLVLNLEVLAEVGQELLAVEDTIPVGLGEIDVELLPGAGGLGSGFRLHTRKQKQTENEPTETGTQQSSWDD